MKTPFLKAVFLLMFSAATVSTGAERNDAFSAGDTDRLKVQTRQLLLSDAGDPLGAELVRAMRKHGFSENLIQQARGICTETRAQDLPLEPVVNKVREGISKGAGPDAIVAAMDRVRSRQAFSADAVRKIPLTRDRLPAARDDLADGLAAGLAQDDARRILSALNSRVNSIDSPSGDEIALAALKTSRDMARLGVSSEGAAGAVIEALEKGYSADEMDQFRKAFISQSRQADPDGLADRYAKAIRNGWNPQQGEPPGGFGTGGGSGVGGGSGGGDGGSSGGGSGGGGGGSGGGGSGGSGGIGGGGSGGGGSGGGKG